MVLGGHTFAADVEVDSSSSWVDVLHFWHDQISCINLEFLLCFSKYNRNVLKKLLTW
jgi:hypothetical protein